MSADEEKAVRSTERCAEGNSQFETAVPGEALRTDVRQHAPADSQLRRAGLVFAAVFLFSTLLMRGPVTAVGPVAEAIRTAFGASYSDYGFLTAIPIAAFGFFSFFSPNLAARLGLRRSVLAAIFILAVGALLRTFASVTLSWPLMLAATVFVGAGIAFLNVYMTVVVKATWPEKLGLMMGLYTGVIGLSGAIGGLTAAPLAHFAGSVAGTMGFWAAAAILGFVLWGAFSRVGDVLQTGRREGRRESASSKARQSITSLAPKPMAWALTGVMGWQSLLIYTVSAWMPPYWASLGMSAEETGVWLFIYLVSGLPASVFTARFMSAVGSDARAVTLLSLAYLLGLTGWIWGADHAWAMLPGSIFAGASQGAMLSVAFLLMSKKSSCDAQMLGVSSLAQGVGYLGAGLGPVIFGALFEASQSWMPAFGFVAVVIVLWGLSGLLSSLRETID